MIFKFSLLTIVLLSSSRVYTASVSGADETFAQLLVKLLDTLKEESISKPWHLRSDESSPQPRVKPIAAPPPSPALGSVDMPVAWPYPPAPTNGNNEFPLLDRFLKSNAIQSNIQSNQINQWNEPTRERKPTPTSAPIEWGVPKSREATTSAPIEWGVPRSREAPTSAPIQWGAPKSEESLVSGPIKWDLQKSPESPTFGNQYIEWGVPQKPQSQSTPLSSSSGVYVPPPLKPEENFYIQHSGNIQGQPKHFSLETFRGAQPQTENKEKKLNVSFIMPPDIRPLSLNFDTGEVQIDFGDDKGRRVPIPADTLPSAKQYRSKLQLDQIFGTQYIGKQAKTEEIPKTLNSYSPTSPTAYSPTVRSNSPVKDEDDEYIVVRHDMNKYAYDLPKGLSVGTNPTAVQTSSAPQQVLQQTGVQPVVGPGNTPTQTVEKYDVSGQKNLHFVLGRVSG